MGSGRPVVTCAGIAGSPHPSGGVGTLVGDVAVLRLLEPGRMLTRRATLDHALDPHRLERPSVLDRRSERVATVRTFERQHVVPLAPPVAVAGRQARVYTVATTMPGTWGLDRTAEGVRVYGESDLAAAEPFGGELSAAVSEASGTNFLVDLSGVTFMDSSGLRALLKALELDDGKDVIVQSSRQVFKLLHLSGLADDSLPNVEVRPPR
jgi:anti-anti-sigma factor